MEGWEPGFAVCALLRVPCSPVPRSPAPRPSTAQHCIPEARPGCAGLPCPEIMGFA